MSLVLQITMAQETRWRKLCKHVFAKREEWWMVMGSLAQWSRDWQTLRVRGCLEHSDSFSRAGDHDDAREVLHRRFGQYQAAAQRAVDEALARRQSFPLDDATCAYVGAMGVVVVVQQPRTLKTCYRPVSALRAAAREKNPADRNATIERAAVRRIASRASFGASQQIATARFEDTP